MNRKLFALCMLASTVSFGQVKITRGKPLDSSKVISIGYHSYISTIDGIAEISTSKGTVYIECTQFAHIRLENSILVDYIDLFYCAIRDKQKYFLKTKDVIKFTPNQPK